MATDQHQLDRQKSFCWDLSPPWASAVMPIQPLAQRRLTKAPGCPPTALPPSAGQPTRPCGSMAPSNLRPQIPSASGGVEW